MDHYRAGRPHRIIVWLIWLLTVIIILAQPSIVPGQENESFCIGAGFALAETPGAELFPWLTKERWRKHAVLAHRRWQCARRKAQRIARFARLALAGALSLATVVDLLTQSQLRRQLGAILALYAVLESLQVRAIINRHCPIQRKVDNGTVALVLILNRLMAPCALVHIADWLTKTVLMQQLDLSSSQFNDDRLARALDDIMPHCRDIWLDVITVAIQRYDIDLSVIFYDLTALVAHGDYAQSEYMTFGHAHNTPMNKRKIKVGLSVSADGHIPVDYATWAGNTADKATVQQNLTHLNQVLRTHGYKMNQVLIIGDRANLDDKLAWAYTDAGIRYLAGLQPQKTVHRQLVESVTESQFDQHPLTQERGANGYWGVPVRVPFSHLGRKVSHYGLVVCSGPMRQALAQTRTRHFAALWPELLSVQQKAAENKARYRRAQDVQARAETKLRNSPVSDFVKVWTSGETGNIRLHWQVKQDELRATMSQDGRYLLVTNDPTLTPQQMLALYRSKDGVEKRITVCKQDIDSSPIYLHQDGRIQAMLLLQMLALLTYSILERQVQAQGLQLTTRRLIAQLEELSLIETHCWDGSTLIRQSSLTAAQRQTISVIQTAIQSPSSRPRQWGRIAAPEPVPLLLSSTR